MKHYKFITEEHARGPEAGVLTAFYEINDDTSFRRSLETYTDGLVLAYDEEHLSDDNGMLPEAEMDENAAADFGELTQLAQDEFDKIWNEASPANRAK